MSKLDWMKDAPHPIRSILVANRGEIACRVLRACNEMGLESIAIRSDADYGALHTEIADCVVHLEGD